MDHPAGPHGGRAAGGLCCAVGFISAVTGLRSTLRMLGDMEARKDQPKPPASFNEHE